jgi:hypothetical protein
MDTQSRRFWEIAGGVLLVTIGLASFGSSFFLGMILMAAGGSLLYRQWQGQDSLPPNERIGRIFSPRTPTVDYEDDEDDYGEEEVPRQTVNERVYAHALQAVERAGLNPDQLQVLPVDVGVMAFKDNDAPVVFRTQPVPDDIDYVQPFVQLRLPMKAKGRIKFEVIDSDGQMIFIHEDIYNLERGRNLISPTARLPIHDGHNMLKAWQIRVSADGTALATHRFEWVESTSAVIRRHIAEDGELSNELRATLAENRLGGMSLDELLAPQDEQAPPPEQRAQQRRQ